MKNELQPIRETAPIHKVLLTGEARSVISVGQDNEAQLCCPFCGEHYLHVTGILPTGRGRSGGAAILFEGESCCHQFQLVVDDHKGNCFLRFEITERRGETIAKIRGEEILRENT